MHVHDPQPHASYPVGVFGKRPTFCQGPGCIHHKGCNTDTGRENGENSVLNR